MEPYGSVNLGMTILTGKERPDPRGQELNLGRQPLYGRGSDVEPRKRNVYMGTTDNPGPGPQEPKLYYDKRSKKDSVRRKIMDQKMSFNEERAKPKTYEYLSCL